MVWEGFRGVRVAGKDRATSAFRGGFRGVRLVGKDRADHPARPDIFDLSIHKLEFLYDEVVEVRLPFPPHDPRATDY